MSSLSAPDEFVRTDVPIDVLSSLELLEHSLARVESEPSWWKWVIVAAHMAVQTTLVGQLTGTTGVGALTDKSTKILLHFLEQRGTVSIDVKLADFPTLLDRAARGECGSGGAGVDLAAVKDQLARLNAVRNGFNHFKDQSWLIEIAHVVPLVSAALLVIEQVDNHGWSFRDANDDVRDSIRKRLSGCAGRLKEFGAQT